MGPDSSSVESLPAPVPESSAVKSQPKKINRRDFLGLAGAGLAAAVLPGKTPDQQTERVGNVVHIYPPEGGEFSVVYAKSHSLPMDPRDLPEELDGLLLELSKNRDYLGEGPDYIWHLKEHPQYGSLFEEFERRRIPLFVGEPRFKPEKIWVGHLDLGLELLEAAAATAIGMSLLPKKSVAGENSVADPSRRNFLKLSGAGLLALWLGLPTLGLTAGGGSKEYGKGLPQEFLKTVRRLHPEWGIFLLKTREVINALKGKHLLRQGLQHVGYIYGGGHVGIEDELLRPKDDELEFLRAMAPVLSKVFVPETLYSIRKYQFDGKNWVVGDTIAVPELKEVVGSPDQITLASLRVTRSEKEQVLDKLSEALDEAAPDVVIMPEYTFHIYEGEGYDSHPLPVVLHRGEGEYCVENPTGERVQKIIERARDLARKHKTNLFLGTFYESLNGLVSKEDYQRGAIEYRNTMLHINPEGKIVGVKRKFHKPDDEFVVRAKSGRAYKVLPMICQDVWDNREGNKIIVPDWVKNGGPYDVLVHSLGQGDVDLDSLSLHIQDKIKMSDEELFRAQKGFNFYYGEYFPYLNPSEAYILISDGGQSGIFRIQGGKLIGSETFHNDEGYSIMETSTAD